jgi:outer membrane biosynthesis protein TonB
MLKIPNIFVKNPIANFFLALIYFIITFIFWPLIIGGLIFYSVKDRNFKYKNLVLIILTFSVFGVQVAAFSTSKSSSSLAQTPALITQNNNSQPQELKKSGELANSQNPKELSEEVESIAESVEIKNLENVKTEDLKPVIYPKEESIKPITKPAEAPKSTPQNKVSDIPKEETKEQLQALENNPVITPKQEDKIPETPVTPTPKTEISSPTQTPTLKDEKVVDPTPVITVTPVTTTTNYDTNGNGKVTCDDFAYKVTDPRILALYPDLDRDDDGIGCESKK